MVQEKHDVNGERKVKMRTGGNRNKDARPRLLWLIPIVALPIIFAYLALDLCGMGSPYQSNVGRLWIWSWIYTAFITLWCELIIFFAIPYRNWKRTAFVASCASAASLLIIYTCFFIMLCVSFTVFFLSWNDSDSFPLFPLSLGWFIILFGKLVVIAKLVLNEKRDKNIHPTELIHLHSKTNGSTDSIRIDSPIL